MQVKIKNLPRLRLLDLLKRRRTTLKTYLSEFGISSYDALCVKCEGIGVQPPSIGEYEECTGNKLPVTASSQQDGIVIVEPITVIDDFTGRKIDVDAPVLVPGVVVVTEQEQETIDQDPKDKPVKRRRKKKEEDTAQE